MPSRNISNTAVARFANPGDDEPDNAAAVDSWSETLGAATAEELLEWALDRWQRRIAVCTAFQAEGVVLVDMAWRIDRGVRVITLDTGRLPQETHDLIEKIRWRYGIQVEMWTPESATVDALVSRQGPNLFYHSLSGRRDCCRVRKVEPLRRALTGFGAWITGLRRDQAPSRAAIRRLEYDDAHGGITKLNPLADWSTEGVWAYIEEHSVPHHALYDQGYATIGCAPCTRAVAAGEDPRAGRWWWETGGEPKECGLHLPAPDTSTRLPVVRS